MISPRHKFCQAMAVLSVAVAYVVSVPATAGAAAPERVSFDVSEPAVTDPYLSELCGTTIQVSATGTVEITLWRNEAGLVVRERDRFPNAWRTFSSPETGESFRIRFEGVSDWDYGTGAQVGSQVTITGHGLRFHIPGETAIAGLVVTEGATVDHFDQGVPIVEGGGVNIRQVGHFPDDVDFGTAICEALKLP